GETFVEFKHASATAIPYADSTFTKVVSIEGVPHFDTRLRFFREAYRVLKPGGVLACADFTLLLHPKTRLERFLVRAGARAWCVPQENIYDYRRVVFLLDRTGFDNVRCELLGSDTIPGYFWGHRSFSAMRGMRKIRGFFKGVLGGLVIDCAAYWLFRRGLLEYVVYSAKKPDR
ncbi:MAG: methyltransferase domain-containing protein, partial [Candidatus Ryanbacteria bacterium]|nr:methyltransferase domain-containing protein [Candidatus Ryanbacteria bacterium]